MFVECDCVTNCQISMSYKRLKVQVVLWVPTSSSGYHSTASFGLALPLLTDKYRTGVPVQVNWVGLAMLASQRTSLLLCVSIYS